MELVESHFNNLSGNLTYDENTDTYEMFSNKLGIKKHLNFLTFKKLFEQMKELITLKNTVNNQSHKAPVENEQFYSTLLNEIYNEGR
jgi:quinol monooxygenase YgiN